MAIEIIGYVGSALLSLCGLPLLIQAIVRGADYSSRWFLYMWLAGEILLFIYTAKTYGGDIPLLSNYTLNIFIILALFRLNRPLPHDRKRRKKNENVELD